MTLKQALERSETVVGFWRDLRRLAQLPRRAADRALVQHYLAANPVRKLQIGAANSVLPGWLSTDVRPASKQVAYLDATQRFPFQDRSIDYIYSEHMIEHIRWNKGAFMLRECRRILKPGGKLRVATPDLKVLLGLYEQKSGATGDQYVKWITDVFLSDVGEYRPVHVINNAFRNWGHQFLYDGELLEKALRHAGLQDIRRCAFGESEDPQLRGIESHGVNADNAEMVAFETMVYEATAPA